MGKDPFGLDEGRGDDSLAALSSAMATQDAKDPILGTKGAEMEKENVCLCLICIFYTEWSTC